jgi:hypothetical protein
MRITIDKINAPPAHALTCFEIKTLLTVVPKDWLRYVQTIHVSATLPSNSRFVRPVIYSAYSNRLNVCSRGLEPEQARREILRELAVIGLNIKPSYGHRPSRQQLKEVDEIIAPLLEKARQAQELVHAHQEEEDVVVGEGGGKEHGVDAV